MKEDMNEEMKKDMNEEMNEDNERIMYELDKEITNGNELEDDSDLDENSNFVEAKQSNENDAISQNEDWRDRVYGNIKISVKTLDLIIVLMVLAAFSILVFGAVNLLW